MSETIYLLSGKIYVFFPFLVTYKHVICVICSSVGPLLTLSGSSSLVPLTFLPRMPTYCVICSSVGPLLTPSGSSSFVPLTFLPRMPTYCVIWRRFGLLLAPSGSSSFVPVTFLPRMPTYSTIVVRRTFGMHPLFLLFSAYEILRVACVYCPF